MSHSKRDQQMLTETYQLQLLSESMPTMSLSQISNNLDLMSESELEYVSIVSERILTEFWKGGSGVLGAVGRGISNTAKSAWNGAKTVGSGIKAAGSQVAQNTKDIYNQSEVKGEADDAVVKARELTQKLIDLVTKAQQNNLIKAQGSVTQMTLEDLIDNLTTAQQSAETFKNAANEKGFTGGVKTAFNKGREQAKSQAPSASKAPSRLPQKSPSFVSQGQPIRRPSAQTS